MRRQFSYYFLTGIMNTFIHWAIFCLCFLFTNDQAISNLIAFCFSASCSFIMNAKFTFKQTITLEKYIIFTASMGYISFLIGYIADQILLSPIVTQIIFSAISLVLGFLFSKYIVFKG